jgi:hypothetical protein
LRSRTFALTEAAEGFRDLFNDIRPHESLGFLTPLEVDRSGCDLFEA